MLGEKLNRSSNRGAAKAFGKIACLWRGSVASLSPRHLSVLLVVCLVAIFTTACDSIDEFVEERTSESTPVTSATRTAIPEGTTAAGPHNFTEVPTPKAGPTASGLVLPVSIAAVPVDLPEYDRSTWRHWIDEDSDCQNARQEVLIAESSVEVTYESGDECRVATGSWLGPYTGKTVSSPSELDIDHLVPLGNAHRSGAWIWDRERKREYANHLGYDDHLIATTSSANRSKGSKGPENWRPELESYWCSYATAWVAVKNAWGLTVTEAEYTALAEMLSTCEMPVLLEPGSGGPLPMPTATMAPTPPAGLRYDPFGPDRNCGDFDTYQEALTFFLAAGGPDVDRHRLDLNGDGEPCETLPGGPSAEESPDPSSSMLALYATFPTPSLEEETNCPPATSSGTLGGQGAAEQTSTASDSDCPLPPTPIPESHATSTPAPHPTVSPTLVPTPTPIPEPHATSTPAPHPTVSPSLVPTPTPTPTPTPEHTPEPAPEEPFEDRDCGDFSEWQDAQDFFLAEGGPDEDPHGLDRDGDGVACQSLPGSPRNERELPTPSPSPSPTAAPEAQLTEEPPAHPDLLFDPSGPDRDCGDFPSWWEAQNFYLAAGGPGQDPHSLDHNGDGIACQSLDGAPANDAQEPDSGSASSDESSGGFVDRDCGDFATWREAQDFFESEGGPEEDPHHLDHNSDGVVCESLDGAPADDPQVSDSSSESSDDSSGGGFVDRDCGDFATWREAQDFFESEGGPEEDLHHLDHNNDGVVCQSLDGAPVDDAQERRIPVLHLLTKAAVDSWTGTAATLQHGGKRRNFSSPRAVPKRTPTTSTITTTVWCASRLMALHGRCARAGFRFCIF